jgi:Flp pilus assembly protein TadG
MRNLFSKSRLLKFLARTARDKRGVTAVAFAITFAVLAPMSLGIFDVYTMTEQHAKLQDALDAATLYAARSNAFTTADVNTIGQKALTANLQLITGAHLQSSSFTLVSAAGDTKVVGAAAVALPSFSPMAFSHDPVSVASEVTRPGNNLEVSLVLDNTGSMKGAPMTSLQDAANQLIDLVVSDTQTPYYSKLAIVPYSNSVNAGTYADAVRGAPVTAQSPLQAACINAVGCTQMKFTSYTRTTPTRPVSSCVSERTGANAFTDASPTGSPVGWVYPPPPPNIDDNLCINATIQPLSSDKTALHNAIATLTADGSTAGQIGVAWGWYMISPNWKSIWPSASQPAAYGAPHLIKAMILMTDGDFNTAYCKGVISGPTSSTDGTSGNTAYHSNCASPNGDSFTQAQSLCNAMKAAPNNVVIYTVAFLHGAPQAQAQAILANCATDAKHAYVPTTGTSLQVAFQSIAADLNKLRISH